MAYDIEFQVADAVKDYLAADATIAALTDCPTCSWYDPMSIDDAHRIIVLIDASESANLPGNIECTVAVVVKSRWAEPSISDDLTDHKTRVNAVRAALSDLTPALLDAQASGFATNFINPERDYKSKALDGWFVSETILKIQAYTTA